MLTVQCPACGSYNDTSATVCYLCKKPLPGSPERPAAPAAAAAPARLAVQRSAGYERPGCVSVFALFFFLSGALGFLSVALFMGDSASLSSATISAQLNAAGAVDPRVVALIPAYFMILVLAMFIGSTLNLVVGFGLWTMRNWARIYILVTQGLSVLLGIPLLFFVVAASKGSLCFAALYLVPLIVNGYIFMWFLEHRSYFR